ncbi:MAG: metal-dependent transcriptional regulator, partial [Caldisericia bacterium]|nr:metal-dependent transcriptional regulator [Caldisericia bacterium]
PSLEDYLEAIAVLSTESEYVHASLISQYLIVKKSSVTVALRHLKRHELIEYKPYKPIKLTLLGQEKAFEILQRHTALRDFFITVLHVESDKANQAACKIEHTIGPEITNKLVEFVRDYKKREVHET